MIPSTRVMLLTTLAALLFVPLPGVPEPGSLPEGTSPRQRAGAAPGPAGTFERAADALERVTWRTRTLVGDERLTRWRFGVAAGTLPEPTFLEAVVRADAAAVGFVEGSDQQPVGPSTPKRLGDPLTAGERAAVLGGMGDEVRMLVYRVETLAPDPAARRRQLERAAALGAELVVVALDPGVLSELDALAEELDVRVALLGDPGVVAEAVAALGPRIGIAADLGRWMEEGIAPREGLAAVADRLAYVRLRDRSALGPDAHDVMLGEGVGGFPDIFHELNRLGLRPLVLMLDATGVVEAPADLFRAVEAFEEVVQPAYGAYFTELSRSMPMRRELVRSGPNEELHPAYLRRRNAEVRRQIEAAIPRQAVEAPAKPRKLLVIDASMAGMSHSTVPHANLLLELMGGMSGAWDTELNNDLNNLKYPAITHYDAVFLNSNVGELLPDPEVREGLARFVREGGGLGGLHGTPWASRNWDEFGDMIGAKAAPHRIEEGVLQPYDPDSPITRAFGGEPLPFREEYYRFQHDGPSRLRWEDVRVLLTVDLDDPAIEPRPWDGYTRPDNVYPVSWIRRYGEGRIFYCSLGHLPETFMSPEIVGHLLAGVQFLVGDLDVDTTPNPIAFRDRSAQTERDSSR